jgi:long-chain acyl-CoA synthetase
MTEAAPMITFPRPGRVIIGSTGEALPGLKVEIRDGEIVAKGPSIMKGYYNRPEETAEVVIDGGYGEFIPSTIVDCTGDEIQIIREGKGVLEY